MRSLAWVLLLLLLPVSDLAQNKGVASSPHPAPHLTGTFIDANENRSLRLHYARNGQAHTFIGFIQSTCVVPDQSKSGEGQPLDLSTIPTGTGMTVYYVRRVVGSQSMNAIMAVRFDRVLPGSALPLRVYIPCFKAAEAPSK